MQTIDRLAGVVAENRTSPRPITAASKERARLAMQRRTAVICVDSAALALAILAPYVLLRHANSIIAVPTSGSIARSPAMVTVRVLCFWYVGLYQFRRIETHRAEISKVVNALLWGFLIEVGIGFMVKQQPPRSWSLLVLLVSLVFVLVCREGVRWHFKVLRMGGQLSREILVVGSGPAARELAKQAAADKARSVTGAGYADDLRVVGTIVDDGLPVVCALDGLVEYCRQHGIQGVIVPNTEVSQPKMAAILRELAWDGVFVDVTFGVEGIDPERTSPRTVGRSLSVLIEPIKRQGWRPVAKRLIDIVASLLLLAVGSPVMVVAAVLIKAETRGPVLFRQQRVGRDGKVFKCLKFRSMVNNAISHAYAEDQITQFGGIASKTKTDPRITRVGKSLRRWSIDEFPQFINILRGDMSLVGPRPLALTDTLLGEWGPILPHRHRLRPGLTCTWQVSGRSATTNDERKRLDVFYVDNWTLWGDVMILARTLGVVLKGEGAF
jgi:exopolysaccharide biosynthesis polyprenyl glycosylphosphotransferase